jgi:hypothetical protein
MPLIIEWVGEDLGREVSAVSRQLLVAEVLVAGGEQTALGVAEPPGANSVLDRRHPPIPARQEGVVDSAVVGHLAVVVVRALPRADRA